MTDTERLNKIMLIVFNTLDGGEWNETVDAIYGCVGDTEYYKSLKEQKRVYEQQRKLNELKQKQKRAKEEAQRLMIEIQNLENDYLV